MLKLNKVALAVTSILASLSAHSVSAAVITTETNLFNTRVGALSDFSNTCYAGNAGCEHNYTNINVMENPASSYPVKVIKVNGVNGVNGLNGWDAWDGVIGYDPIGAAASAVASAISGVGGYDVTVKKLVNKGSAFGIEVTDGANSVNVGDIVNEGELTESGIKLNTNARTNVLNKGRIVGSVSVGDKAGRVVNDTTMSTFRVEAGGDVDAFVNNGEIINSGAFADGSIYVDSSAHLGNLVNNGLIEGNVALNGKVDTFINKGAIGGGINLSANTLTLQSGPDVKVGGFISGTSDSSVRVDGVFEATNGANVGYIEVTKRGKLSLAPGVTWRSANPKAAVRMDLSNYGTIELSDNSVLAPGIMQNWGTISSKGDAVINGDVQNLGTLEVNSGNGGSTLVIQGKYYGAKDSLISLHGKLGDDQSPFGKLAISGDSTGQSNVRIINENGSGSSTLEGIKIIQVDGKSGAEFTLDGRVVAGVYDYKLERGQGKNSSNWYLTSDASSTPAPAPAPAPGADTPGADTPAADTPAADTPAADTPAARPSVIRMVRPEIASYAANLQAARTMFDLTLSDRSGARNESNMWMRNQGGHIRSSMGDGQNSTSANRYVLQLGGNIKTWDVGNSRTVLGVMGGYGHQNSNSSNSLNGNASKGSINGYSGGLYSTWYQDASEQNGLYVDSWLQYGSFSNSVKGNELVQESYRSHGLTGSLESGYNVTAAQWDSSSAKHKLILQPHAQTVWSGVKLAEHTESNGTRVQGNSSSDVRMRLGVTAELNVTSLEDRNVSVTPYVTVDWLHGSNSTGVNMNGVGETIVGTRNMAEVKTGVKGDISKNLSLAASVAQKFGQKDLRDIGGTLDLRYTF